MSELKSPKGGNGNPLQYSCLENSMDRGTWRATVQGVTKSRTQLSDWVLTHPQESGQDKVEACGQLG